MRLLPPDRPLNEPLPFSARPRPTRSNRPPSTPFPAPRPLRALGRAHLDRAVGHPRLERGLRERGRALLDRAVFEPVHAAVHRALHALALELALVELPAAVHARVRERE